ncbi:hypothetical protein C8J57DRAFT_1236060 [Mycena rebaudengoi]|nr:hypothetical protein C8J57DRAFT_1236060 [Mycena rebaudengoi]
MWHPSLFLASEGPPNRPGTSSMPPKEGALWEFFFKGPKQNASMNEAYCLGCIRHYRRVEDPPNDTDLALKDRLKWEEAAFTAAREEAGHVCGEKSAMIAHLIGRKPSAQIKGSAPPTAAVDSTDDESDTAPTSKKRKKLFRNVEKAMKQPELVVYRGANIPFSSAEIERLFMMFRSTACDVIPGRDTMSGTLLNAASARVEKHLKSDGWKDDSKNPITGVNVSANGKSNGQKKDGASMCLAFESMIDKAEQDYGCIMMVFVCDNDGGSQHGHKDLGLKRLWIFYSHSTKRQLILGDYLALNEEASAVAEQATDLIHWILSHDRVRKSFDDAQHENNFVVLVYLLANITWWTTHYVAFRRLLDLKAPLRHAAYLRREEIIEAQLGCEQNRKAVKKITETANAQCDLLENNNF